MTLTPGTRLGPYEIRSSLGVGGMGEVYCATDSNLKRQVAIKVLPQSLATDPERLARFQREAELLAALSHPNIAHIHGLERADGITALVMELVDGPTLADRIAQGPIPINEALPIARQFAEALEAAHEHGIIHRDLKPANIKLRHDGTVKVLDFGLAKVIETTAPSASQSPTIATTAMTQTGVILGTIPYMSPEQARGLAVDRRADIWAFGCVLYEMLTGKRAFEGGSVTDTLACVLQREPDFDALPAETSTAVRRLLARCLDKDRNRRPPQIAIARFQIEEDLGTSSTSTRDAADAGPQKRLKRGLALGLVAGTLIGGTVAWFGRPRETPVAAGVTRLLVGVAPADQFGGSEGRPTRPVFALSSDGRALVFSAQRANQRSLYLRRFDQVDAVPLEGTDGAIYPFISPDGRWAGFWIAGELRKIPIGGGPALRICAAPPIYGASWGEDDRIVFARLAGGLWEVPAGGGTPTELTVPNRQVGEISHRLSQVLPGGDAVLYTAIRNRFPRWDQAQIFAYSRRTRASKLLVDGGADARYVPTGHLVYAREGVLLAVPFDLSRLELTGSPIGVVPDVMQAAYARGQGDDSGAAQFTISTTGTLVYLPGGTFRPAERSVLRVDRTGQGQTLPIVARAYATLRLSSDGRQIALNTYGRDRDIWIHSLTRTTLTKLNVPGRHSVPIWTPNGNRLTYASATSGPDNIYWTRADGAGSPELLIDSNDNLVPASWTPDGRGLLFYPIPAEPAADVPFIRAFDVERKGPSTPIAGTSAASAVRVGGVDVSPDGRWIAYHSAESGQSEVYVQAYPEQGSRMPVSTDGGISPVWRADGRELFYVRPDAQTQPLSGGLRLMAVTVSAGPAITFGATRELFAGRYEMNMPARAYDVSGDGQRFFLLQERERPPEVITQMIVVQNWFEELKRLVPTR